MTGAESHLWAHLRGRQIEGFKFRRKAMVGPYIVDFACLSARLVVEVGGEMFDRSPVVDATRAVWLESRGYRVVRFTPVEIGERMEQVLGTIQAELAARPYLSVASARGSFRGRRSLRNRPAMRGP